MKIALITDTHWGIKSASPIIIDYFKKFYDNIFFPYLDENDIKTVIHLGDLVDSRKNINYTVAQSLHEIFLQPLKKREIDAHFLLGNHDQYNLKTIMPNSLDMLFTYGDYNFNYYVTAEEVTFDGLKVILIPWICEENREHTYKLIKTTKAQIAMGHLELSGFEFYRGIISHEGESKEVYRKFDRVFSGHYHQSSTSGNITYLGAPCEFTWADFDCDRGFHVFDTETREIEFIKNPYKMFHIINYNEDNSNIDLSIYRGTIVKVNPSNKQSQIKFDEFLSRLDMVGTLDYNIIPDSASLLLPDNYNNDELQDTLTIMKEYINELDDTIDKDSMKILFNDLYVIALNQLEKI